MHQGARLTACSLTLAALVAGVLPSEASAAPTVSFRNPSSGGTLSGTIKDSSACEVTGSRIDRVRFYLGSAALNTEETSPWNCSFDTRNFADGAYTLRAVAYDSSGATASTQVSVNIRNAASAAPTIGFTAPAEGGALSGNVQGPPDCVVTGTSISRVLFYLNGTWTNTDGNLDNGLGCWIDTTRYPDGPYTVTAVAYNADGKSATATRGIVIQNAPASSAPTVSFQAPATGGALSGNVQGPPNCTVTGTNISQVMFYINGTWTNTDGNLDNGLGCWIDTTKYQDGPYTLKAVAYNAAGATATATRDIVIKNTVSTAPSVSFQAPAVGGTLSGNVQGPPHCVVTGSNIAHVMFYLNDLWTNTDGNLANGLGCWIDTTKYADGDYTVKAVAYSAAGATATATRAIKIKNGLSSTGTRAIPTFESIGLYWTPPSNPGAAGCDIRYRKAGESAWKPGLPMWYDSRNSECRGSLVHLAAGTDYEVQFALPGQQPIAQLATKTWPENFPIAKTVQLSGTRTTPLNIVEGGTPSGYVLYTGPGTIDVGNGYDHNVVIAAPYVIVRGLVLKGARVDAIRMVQGTSDVVIEDNDISGWGRDSGNVSNEGWRIGVNEDSGIKASCSSTNPWLVRTVIQRNRIHHPRYGSNSWSEGHPAGPNAVFFGNCGGNHVFRHNEIYSDWGRYFMDGYGGADNFSNAGMPNADSDVYGNRISQVWDDAIEAEGANRNVRIWSNYTDHTAVAIATSATHAGPVYIFRNVQNRSRQLSQSAPDNDEPLGRAFAKSGSTSSFGGGARYVFHNTLLQAPPLPGTLYTQGAAIGLKGNANQPLTNTVSRNNIYHIWKPWLSAIDYKSGTGNSLDYDLFNGNIVAYPGAEANGIVGTPIYQAGHGWENESGGFYQLAPASPGYDRGVILPNFNDGFTGSAPDMGAHEAGTPGMRFGLGDSAIAQ